MTETFATYICAYCLQENEIFVDISEGPNQVLIEDCSVCCRPNELHIRIDEETSDVSVEAEIEG